MSVFVCHKASDYSSGGIEFRGGNPTFGGKPTFRGKKKLLPHPVLALKVYKREEKWENEIKQDVTSFPLV